MPTWSSTEVRGRVTDVSHGTADSVTLTIRPNGNWAGFRAGQFTQLTVEIDGVRHTRCYSMATADREAGTFELTIKAHPQGTVSRYLKDHADGRPRAGPGSGRAATSPLPAASPRPPPPHQRRQRHHPGDGHAPHAVRRGPRPARSTFVHYALTEADMIYRDELAGHRRRPTPTSASYGSSPTRPAPATSTASCRSTSSTPSTPHGGPPPPSCAARRR